MSLLIVLTPISTSHTVFFHNKFSH